MTLSYDDMAQMIDHALLRPTLTDRELEAGCRLAVHYQVASVCVLPYFLPLCVNIVRGSGVKASSTIGFPHGAQSTAVKLVETELALDQGGEELDVVVNISKALSGDFAYVKDELTVLTGAVHARGRKIKIIFENAYLAEPHKLALCRICGEIGADWAKTSTGFGPDGATVSDVALMRAHCPPEVAIKASGGVRDLNGALSMRQAGATRIGTSATREILQPFRA
jgi:deoxyribose-phosphate aldolase